MTWPTHALLLVVLLAACGPSEDSSGGIAGRPYDRNDWQHWIDEDHDCQDARTEVLIAESIGRGKFEDERKCKVERGEWRCPYTGELIRDPDVIDIDHMVPLGNTHRSGGDAWGSDKRREYANDLSRDEHLVAVARGANRSKSDQGPEAWLPQNAEFRCEYVQIWVDIKQRWELRMTEDEQAAVDAALQLCDAGGVPELPQASARGPAERTLSERTPSERTPSEPDATASEQCCQVCRSGKPCGDSCVPRDRNCSKPPGCACAG
jgi:Protein of unknown function (DUF1524)